MRGMLRGKSNEGHRYTHRETKMMNDMLRKCWSGAPQWHIQEWSWIFYMVFSLPLTEPTARSPILPHSKPAQEQSYAHAHTNQPHIWEERYREHFFQGWERLMARACAVCCTLCGKVGKCHCSNTPAQCKYNIRLPTSSFTWPCFKRNSQLTYNLAETGTFSWKQKGNWTGKILSRLCTFFKVATLLSQQMSSAGYNYIPFQHLNYLQWYNPEGRLENQLFQDRHSVSCNVGRPTKSWKSRSISICLKHILATAEHLSGC